MPDAEYMREYRKTKAGREALIAQQQRQRARAAAVRRLITQYPAQWQAIWTDELRQRGLI